MSLTTATDGEVIAWMGERLRALRKSQELTSTEAAAAAGLSRRTLHRTEHGENPTLGTLVRLLRLYGRLDSLEALLDEPEVSPMSLVEASRRHRRRPAPARARNEGSGEAPERG